MRLSRTVAVPLACITLLAPFAARADPVVTARALTSAEPRCRSAPSGTDIVVCGRRAADRYRVPFLSYPDGDPRNETVSGERNRLASAPAVKCGLAWNQNTCGAAGASVTVAFGGGLKEKPRVRGFAK